MGNQIIGSRYRGVTRLSLALLFVLIALPAQAAFYKWTDESGQVHYTQNPPLDVQKQSVEEVRVDTRTSAPVASPPIEKDGMKSCGSIVLPAKRLDAVTNIAMFREAIAIWQKYLDENGAKSDVATRQGMTDRRCAIAHANRELQALGEVEQRLNTNYERITDELEELKQKVKECDSSDRANEEYSAVECKRQYRPRISQLETMLRRMITPKKLSQPGE